MSDLYHEMLLEEAKSPQNQGAIEDADEVFNQVNASCGDQVVIYLNWQDDHEHIKELKWQGQGCVISQAAMSVLSAMIKDKDLGLNEIQTLTQADLERALGIHDISPGRIKCLMLGLSAFQKYHHT